MEFLQHLRGCSSYNIPSSTKVYQTSSRIPRANVRQEDIAQAWVHLKVSVPFCLRNNRTSSLDAFPKSEVPKFQSRPVKTADLVSTRNPSKSAPSICEPEADLWGSFQRLGDYQLSSYIIWYNMHPWKLTCPLKRGDFKRKVIFQPAFFQGIC